MEAIKAQYMLVIFNIGPHIKNDAFQTTSYSMRMKKLLKKVNELSILYKIEMAIIYDHS